MTRVTFLLMRHPKHVNDVVGPEGEEQIRAAARKHLLPYAEHPIYAFCTEKQRARQTAHVALEAIGRILHIPEETDFGFQYVEAETEVQYPWDKALEKVAALRQAGQFVSVKQMCDEIWPPGMVIRHVLRATMKQYAQRLAWPGDEIVILVGNHATNVYATPNPETTDGYPDYCSIARYDWEVNGRGVATLKFFSFLAP